MKIMILAAGRGERMRPLTDALPKPLLEVGGKPLIVHLLEGLARAGFTDIVMNYAHLGEKFVEALGEGERYGVRLQYSPEESGRLETGGGIKKALPLLDNGPFLVVNGDIWTDYPFFQLRRRLEGLAHLVLVPNPPHHAGGDFSLHDGRVDAKGDNSFTFSGIGVYSHELFKDSPTDKFPLAPLLRQAMNQGMVSGELYHGGWEDCGTPERLRILDRRLRGENPE